MPIKTSAVGTQLIEQQVEVAFKLIIPELIRSVNIDAVLKIIRRSIRNVLWASGPAVLREPVHHPALTHRRDVCAVSNTRVLRIPGMTVSSVLQ